MGRRLWQIDLAVEVSAESKWEAVEASLESLRTEAVTYLASSRGGEFTGHEAGPGGIQLTFESRQPARLLAELARLAVKQGLDARFSVRAAGGHSPAVEGMPAGGVEEFIASGALEKAPPRAKHRPRVGDYYAFPLADGRYAHAQFVYRNFQKLDLVLILSLIASEPARVEVLQKSCVLRGPIQTSVRTAVRVSRWERVGSGPIHSPFSLEFRTSVGAAFGGIAREYSDWYIEDFSTGDVRRVGFLSSEQRKLPCGGFYGPPALQDVVLGWDPYSGAY